MKKQKTMKQQLNAQFYKGNIPAFCVAAAISIPLGMLNVWVSWLLQVIIDEMTGVPGSLGLRTICLLTVVQITGAAVLLLLRRAAEPRFVRRALRQYKSFAFEKMTEKSMAEFGRENTSGYLSALTNDVNQIEQDYLIQRFVLISNMVTLVGGLALMLWNSPLMTGIALVLAALPIAVSFLTGSKLTAAQKRVSDRNAGFASLLSDCLNVVLPSSRASVRKNRCSRFLTAKTTDLSRKNTKDTASGKWSRCSEACRESAHRWACFLSALFWRKPDMA